MCDLFGDILANDPLQTIWRDGAMVDGMIEASPKAPLLYLCNCRVHREFYWNNNKSTCRQISLPFFLRSTSHCVECLWGLTIMDDWRGERESNGLCLCEEGNHVGSAVKKSLLELSGRTAASSYATGTRWPALVRVCLCVSMCVCVNFSAGKLRLVLHVLTRCRFFSANVCQTV